MKLCAGFESGKWTDYINPDIVFYRINDDLRAVSMRRLKVLKGTSIKVIKTHKSLFSAFGNPYFVR